MMVLLSSSLATIYCDSMRQQAIEGVRTLADALSIEAPALFKAVINQVPYCCQISICVLVCLHGSCARSLQNTWNVECGYTYMQRVDWEF